MKQGLMPRGYSRFDIVAGHYWWLFDHHSGQGSREYAKGCRVSRYFRPSPLSNGPDDELAREVYDSLCDKHGCTHDRLLTLDLDPDILKES